MQAQQLLTADILDILFEGRNKAYGAYVLRKGYNRRLTIALLSTAAFTGLLFLVIPLANPDQMPATMKINPPIVIEIEPSPPAEKKKDVAPPPKPRAAPKPKPPSVQYIVPVIVTDDSVNKKDILPPNDDLVNARIASITQQGTGTADLMPPPEGTANDKGSAPGSGDDDPKKIFKIVQHESEYPGGKNAWMRFLIKTFRYPMAAEEKEIEGTVTVQFVVDESGNVSNVQAISGPEELMKEAVRVISKSGKWMPAIQNGRKVKSYKSQGIVFRLSQ